MRLKSAVTKKFGRAFRYLAGGDNRNAARRKYAEKRMANRLARHKMANALRRKAYDDIVIVFAIDSRDII